ncbi:E3 binding domain-containing protein, partial [Salmonella enterica subsp. enterica serovar Virginia]|nr:E3 binding domain-containing protein [Salmonella enterica subsp. enterica serovar Virginia]
ALSPAIRRLLAEHNLEASAIKGTGVGGRLTREDVEKHLAKGEAEATTLAHRGKLLFHSGAELPGIARDLPQMLRQQRFQFLAQQT